MAQYKFCDLIEIRNQIKIHLILKTSRSIETKK